MQLQLPFPDSIETGAARRAFATEDLEGDMSDSFEVGTQVELSDLGRRHSKRPDRRGVVIAASKTGTSFRVRWEAQKTADFVHRTFLQVGAKESRL